MPLMKVQPPSTEQLTKLRDAILGTDPDLPDTIQPISYLRTLVQLADVDTGYELISSFHQVGQTEWRLMMREVSILLERMDAALTGPDALEAAAKGDAE